MLQYALPAIGTDSGSNIEKHPNPKAMYNCMNEWMAKWYGVHVNKRWKDKHRWFNLILLCEMLFHFVYTFSRSNRPALFDSPIPCCVLSVTKESAREFCVSKYSFRMSIHLASWVVGVGKISGICWFTCMCVGAGATAWYRAQHHIILQYTFWQQCSCCSIYLNVSLFKVVGLLSLFFSILVVPFPAGLTMTVCYNVSCLLLANYQDSCSHNIC